MASQWLGLPRTEAGFNSQSEGVPSGVPLLYLVSMNSLLGKKEMHVQCSPLPQAFTLVIYAPPIAMKGILLVISTVEWPKTAILRERR